MCLIIVAHSPFPKRHAQTVFAQALRLPRDTFFPSLQDLLAQRRLDRSAQFFSHQHVLERPSVIPFSKVQIRQLAMRVAFVRIELEGCRVGLDS